MTTELFSIDTVNFVTTEQVQRIVDKDFPNAQATVIKLTELRNHGFRYVAINLLV